LQIPEFLNKTAVLKIHARQIASFGGSEGIRDSGLLESALAQPQATFAGNLYTLQFTNKLPHIFITWQ
jgi:death-on-curing protein